MLLLLCIALEAPAHVFAQEVSFVLEPSHDDQLDNALGSALNLPSLQAAAAIGEPASEEWNAAVTVERRRLTEIARAHGYLDADIEISSDASGVVRLLPQPGPLFHIAAVQLRYAHGEPLDAFTDALSAHARGYVGSVAGAPQLASLSQGILRELRRRSYPFVEIADSTFELDREAAMVVVGLSIDTGPLARFGPINVTGTRAIDPADIEALAPFSPGDPFDAALLESFDAALAAMPQLRKSRTEIADTTQPGLANVLVRVSEGSDPARLEYLKWPGMLALGAILAALAGRQLIAAAGPLLRPKPVQAFDIAILAAMIFVAALTLRRMLALAFPA